VLSAQFLSIVKAPVDTAAGHLASGAWFVSNEILGNKNTRLYAGSMTEWTNPGNPTVGQ